MQNFPEVVTNTRRPTIFGTNQTCSPGRLFAQFLSNMKYFPNHWSMQNLFTSGIGLDILIKVFEDDIYILYLGSLGFIQFLT